MPGHVGCVLEYGVLLPVAIVPKISKSQQSTVVSLMVRWARVRVLLSPLLLVLFASVVTSQDVEHKQPVDDVGYADDATTFDTGRTVTVRSLSVPINSSTSIVKGQPATNATAYHLSYAIPQGRFLCGAILIHPDILLSAGHCETRIYSFSDPYLWSDAAQVRLGGLRRDGSDALETIRVVREREHPDFRARRFPLAHDFRLIQLETLSRAPLIPYNTARSYPAPGDTVTVIGFGATRNRGPFSKVLRQTNLTIVDFDTCKRQLFNAPDDDTMICATSGDAGSGACQGDSGGPIFSDNGTLVGLVSWGIACGTRPRLPGVYARVSSAIDFIEEGICELSQVPPASCPNVTNRVTNDCQNCVQGGILSLVGVQLHVTILGSCMERCATFGVRALKLLGWKCGACP